MDRARTTTTLTTPPTRPAEPPPPSVPLSRTPDNVVPLRAFGDAAPAEPNAGRVANDDDGAQALSAGTLDTVVLSLVERMRAAHHERDEALGELALARAENRRLLAERQQLTGLVTRWQSYALEIERWAEASERYHQERLDGVEQQLLRTFHEKERALEVADELLASRLWMRRWRRRTLADELELLRGVRAEDPDATRG